MTEISITDFAWNENLSEMASIITVRIGNMTHHATFIAPKLPFPVASLEQNQYRDRLVDQLRISFHALNQSIKEDE